LFTVPTNYSLSYARISDLYLNEALTQDSSSSIGTRQQNYILPKSTSRNLNSGLDRSSTNTILSYNYNIGQSKPNTPKLSTNLVSGLPKVVLDPVSESTIAKNNGFDLATNDAHTLPRKRFRSTLNLKSSSKKPKFPEYLSRNYKLI